MPALAVESEDTGSLFQPDPSQQVTAYAPDERVRIVIELEDAPLLDSHKVSQYASVTEFLDSNAAQSTERKLERARKAVKSQLATKLDDVEVRYEYTTVFNGLSVEADYADLETIQDLPGVKDAYVSQVYQLIEPVNETKLADSVPAIGGDISQKTGYTGKGMVVAILDTGLDTSHEAFQNKVNEPKFSKQDIAKKLESDSLRAGNVNVTSIYQSDKIPFAYDYYGNDTNVSGGNSHGTHVAGIVGANKGQVTGVAPDAQLMIMKIFGDDGSGAYDSDIIAALEDAVVLGADAVNMSLGMTAGFSEAAAAKTREVYQRVKNAGISLMCAAGNEYSSSYKSAGGTVGFGRSSDEQDKERVMKALQSFLRPEFINRVDEIVYFHQLTKESFAGIARIMLRELTESLSAKGFTFTYDDTLVAYLVDKSYSAAYGARNLRRCIQKELEDPMAVRIIESFDHPITHIRASASGEKVTLETL